MIIPGGSACASTGTSGAWPTKCLTSISAAVPMRGVKVIHLTTQTISVLRYMIACFSRMSGTFIGADKYQLIRSVRMPEPCWNGSLL